MSHHNLTHKMKDTVAKGDQRPAVLAIAAVVKHKWPDLLDQDASKKLITFAKDLDEMNVISRSNLLPVRATAFDIRSPNRTAKRPRPPPAWSLPAQVCATRLSLYNLEDHSACERKL